MPWPILSAPETEAVDGVSENYKGMTKANSPMYRHAESVWPVQQDTFSGQPARTIRSGFTFFGEKNPNTALTFPIPGTKGRYGEIIAAPMLPAAYPFQNLAKPQPVPRSRQTTSPINLRKALLDLIGESPVDLNSSRIGQSAMTGGSSSGDNFEWPTDYYPPGGGG